MPSDPLARPERPAQTYDEARARFDALLSADTPAVDPLSRSQLLGPGHRTERAIVFLHGLTNSPRQFTVFQERFLARGYSVLVPRIPYHGYTDRMSVDLALLTAQELVDTVAEAVDLAAGLADEVTVSGLSLGGVLAVWAAQYRSIAVAAPIAPSIGLSHVPVAATRWLFRSVGWLPNRFVWWDPRYKQNLPGPTYAYPRFATRALIQTQRLGYALIAASRLAPPRARSVWLISNAADLAVSNAAGRKIVANWRAVGATNVHEFQFPGSWKLFHDLIDPLQPNAQPDRVHPILESLIADGRAPDPSTLRTQGTSPQSR